eukprot:6266735-Amphidinium_carterae.1
MDDQTQNNTGIMRSNGTMVSIGLVAWGDNSQLFECWSQLDVHLDGQDQRRRTFQSAVESLTDTTVEGGEVMARPRFRMGQED